MNIIYFSILLAFFLFGVIFDRTVFYIQAVIFGIYSIGYIVTPSSKFMSLRRKIQIASWTGLEYY